MAEYELNDIPILGQTDETSPVIAEAENIARTASGGRIVVRPETPGAAAPEHTTHHAQAKAEGVATSLGATLPFKVTDPQGVEHEDVFKVATKVAIMPYLEFVHAAEAGTDSAEQEGMAALYDLIGGCLSDPAEFKRFRQFCVKHTVDDEDLMRFVSAAMEIITARPTERRGGSSAASPTTSPSTKASSSLPPAEELAGLVPVSSLLDL